MKTTKLKREKKPLEGNKTTVLSQPKQKEKRSQPQGLRNLRRADTIVEIAAATAGSCKLA